MAIIFIKLLLSLVIILGGAEIFTNGIEWLGKKLNLSEGAVGSVLAAVGTALPETMIPLMAIIFGGKGSQGGHEIGIGAILGAPFMLSTLAMFITGSAVVASKGIRKNYHKMQINAKIVKRDLVFFLIVYSIAILVAFFPNPVIRLLIILFLIFSYVYYVFLNFTDKNNRAVETNLRPLLFNRKNKNPKLNIILMQILFALFLIILGAQFFVYIIKILADILNIPAFILSLVIAPVATELPEKFNSIIWIMREKDTLALGNITGAMVFQSSLIPALGIALTNWNLNLVAFTSSILALLSTTIIYLQIKLNNYLSPYTLMFSGLFYLIFLILVLGRIIY